MPYGKRLKKELQKRGHKVFLCSKALQLKQGNCAFFLGCEKIVPSRILKRNTHNLVIHESALPRGKGWSPLTWQILEGENDIPITLFEATEGIDSGNTYFQDVLHFKGHELIDELRKAQGEKTIKLAFRFVNEYPNVRGRKQKGKETFYARRTPKDSELDIRKPLKGLFNQLRVADNERYPAFFTYKGHTYIVRIEKGNCKYQEAEFVK